MDLNIIIKNDDVVVSSLQIAKVFEKEHHKVMRSINKIAKNFSE